MTKFIVKKIVNVFLIIVFCVALYVAYKSSLVIYFQTKNDYIPTSETGNPEEDNLPVNPIDIVYSAIEKKDNITVITYPEQNGAGGDDVSLNNYLDNNLKQVIVPEGATGGYLYIKLRKPLKTMWLKDKDGNNVSVLQKVQIKTNKVVFHQQGYRLDTNESFPVYMKDQEFLYGLTSFPIRGAITNNLSLYLKNLKISGIVSDTSGNGIEKIIFVRQR